MVDTHALLNFIMINENMNKCINQSNKSISSTLFLQWIFYFNIFFDYIEDIKQY